MKASRARIYGNILFDTAVNNKTEDSFFEILKELAHTFETNPWIYKFFNSPLISTEDKIAFLQSEHTLQKFLEVLLANNEVHLLPKIFAFYETFLDRHVGHKEITIASATPLTTKKQKEIAGTLSEKIDIHFAVDESLLDGFRVYWNSKLLPLSSKDFLHSLATKISSETILSE